MPKRKHSESRVKQRVSLDSPAVPTASPPPGHEAKRLKGSPGPLPATSPTPLFGTLPPNPFASLVQGAQKNDVRTDGNGEDWTKVEKRKVKKAKKAEERMDNSPPRFFYVNSEIVKRKEAVGICDVRDLVLHLLGEAGPQPWLKVDNRNAIKKVVTLFVPGILPEHINLNSPATSATTNPNLPISIPLPRNTSIAFPSSPAPIPSLKPASEPKPILVKTLFGGTKEIFSGANTPDAVGSAESSKPSVPQLPFIGRTFSHACPTRAPGDSSRMHSVLSAFFYGPVSPDERKRRAAVSAKAVQNLDSLDPMRYVLTPAQMLENEYPLPTYMRDASVDLDTGAADSGSSFGAEWAETPKPRDGEEGAADVLAIDCEMCLTEDGKELTRMCVIDFVSGKVLLDRLVKPSKPILDYLTKWSGITEEALRDVTTSLSEVRSQLLSFLDPAAGKRTPILLGHSLENDLRALKLAHPRCIDTALLYQHPRGRPLKPGLAWLTNKWCAREIQNRGAGGHDAEEDARACIELLRRKMEGGPGFGEFKNTAESESVFERLARSTRGSGTGEPGSGEGARLTTAVVDRGNPATWHGAGAGSAVACQSDEEVVKGVLRCLDECDFIWARLMGVAEAQNWIKPKAEDPPIEQAAPQPAALDAAATALNAHLSLIHASLPARTAFVVFTGHSDPRQMVALQARKAAFEGALKAAKDMSEVPKDVRWSAADGRDLEESVEHARRGMLFLSLK